MKIGPLALEFERYRRSGAFNRLASQCVQQRLNPYPFNVAIERVTQQGIKCLSMLIVHALNDSYFVENCNHFKIPQPVSVIA